MTVVLLAGLYLALDRWSLGDPWISATFAILFVLFGLQGAVLSPADARLAELAEHGGAASPDYERESRKADMFGGAGAAARRRGDLPHGRQARRVVPDPPAAGRTPLAAGEHSKHG